MPELTVLYDGACGFCRGSVKRLRRFDRRGRIELVDLHEPSVAQRFPQVDAEEARRLMQAVDRRGRIYSGADVWARIGLTLPGWNLLAWILLVPGIRSVARMTYAWIARNRYRWSGQSASGEVCELHGGESPPEKISSSR